MPGAVRTGQRLQEDGIDNGAEHVHCPRLQAQVCFRGHVLGVQGWGDGHPDEIGKKRMSLPKYFMLLGSAGRLSPYEQGNSIWELNDFQVFRFQFLILSRFLACAETALSNSRGLFWISYSAESSVIVNSGLS